MSLQKQSGRSMLRSVPAAQSMCCASTQQELHQDWIDCTRLCTKAVRSSVKQGTHAQCSAVLVGGLCMTCMHMHIQVRQQGSLHCRSSSPLSMAHQGCCCLVLGSQQVSACLMLTQPGCLHVRCLAAAVGRLFASSVLCERDHQSRHCRSRKHQLSQTRLGNEQ